jgi:hypothetical protein
MNIRRKNRGAKSTLTVVNGLRMHARVSEAGPQAGYPLCSCTGLWFPTAT